MRFNKTFWILTSLVLIACALLAYRSWLKNHPAEHDLADVKSPTSTNENLSSNRPSQTLSQAGRYLAEKGADRDFDWKRPIEFYGRVVDQNGDPVPHTHVRLQWSDSSESGATESNIKTEADGSFALRGVKGKSLSVLPQKNGYTLLREGNEIAFEYADPTLPWFHKPDSNKPVLFRLFKHGKPDQLVTGKLEKPLKHDGTDTIIPLDSSIGSLIVRSITAEKTEARPKPDWSVNIELQEAMLKPTTEPFPSFAPGTGYSATFHRAETFESETWSSNFEQNFYFVTQAPVRYGKIKIFFAASGRVIRIEYWVNPSGERSLNSGPG